MIYFIEKQHLNDNYLFKDILPLFEKGVYFYNQIINVNAFNFDEVIQRNQN